MNFSKIPPPKRRAFEVIPARECLAKTRVLFQNGERLVEKGCDLYTHLWATCRVLQEMRRQWADSPKGRLILPEALLLAAAHDIGKMTPAFLCKIYAALALPTPWPYSVDEPKGGHARCSEIVLHDLCGKDFARLAGRHHGGATWTLGPQDTLENEKLGGEAWQQARREMLLRLCHELNLPEHGPLQLPEKMQPLILGAVILADWLSSGMDLPYRGALPTAEDICGVIDNAGLKPVGWKRGLDFSEIFGFPANPLQQACENRAEPGGVYVIESGMGSGKTEAALSLAYQLLSRKDADGLYFAMPTKLTSEKIFDRLNLFLQRVLTDETPAEPLLIHGDSWLDWSLPEGDEDGFGMKENGSWFQTKKRALLAPFAAGTVDQALLSVINVRHNALRAFALAGKVVILDEVHSYDNYTGSLIVSLVRRIREWGGTVIILSATLTAVARARLLGCEEQASALSSAYPLISIGGDNGVEEMAIPVESESEVALRQTFDEAAAMGEALERAMRGEQVLWIENTVKDAQRLYRQLAAAAVGGIELGLIHSRFPMCRRRSVEDRWVRLLGRGGGEERKKCGRILVATQVLEQSVDVDADFLITRLAPGDMLFQRLGRLWRHPSLDAIRPMCASREALVIVPEVCRTTEELLRHQSEVLPYDAYWVLRTFQVWRELASVRLPKDIRPLLEQIYADTEEQGAAQVLKADMQKEREELERKALISLGMADAPGDDERASTRINDHEEVQVLLIRKGNGGLPLRERVAALFADAPIVIPLAGASARERVFAVRALLRCMINVPEYLAPRYEDFETEPLLGGIMWTGQEHIRPIRAAYVDESGLLLSQAGTVLRSEWCYHEKLGYCVN